jgi:Arc/MetJ family transcription regulator
MGGVRRKNDSVRTTVNIDDRLLGQAKLEAARSGRSLGDVVDDALRLLLAPAGGGLAAPLDLPVFGGSGMHPGVDLENREGLAALLDDEAGTHAAG